MDSCFKLLSLDFKRCLISAHIKKPKHGLNSIIQDRHQNCWYFPCVFQSVACFRLRLRTLDWFLSVGTSETGSQLTLPWWQKGDWNELLKVERAYGYRFVGKWWVSCPRSFMQTVDIRGILWSLGYYTLYMILEWYVFVHGACSE